MQYAAQRRDLAFSIHPYVTRAKIIKLITKSFKIFGNKMYKL